ncbi:MAG: nicotinamidase [Planctomycetes bacterium]|nr:nicotinamidase [Planctomycetota bacterium]
MDIGPGDALLVVDIQRDFLPGGALGVADGDAVVPVIRALMPRFGTVILSRDWHPPDHSSFAENPCFVDGSWPVHCVAGTPGAEFHPDLGVPKGAIVVSKATHRDREAYSAFDGSDLAERLRARGIERVFICGLATDYCVRASVLDARAAGFEVVVIEDACRGVDVPPGNVDAAWRVIETAGARRIRSRDV